MNIALPASRPPRPRGRMKHAHPCVKAPYAEKPFVYYSPAVNVITVLSPVVYVIWSRWVGLVSNQQQLFPMLGHLAAETDSSMLSRLEQNKNTLFCLLAWITVASQVQAKVDCWEREGIFSPHSGHRCEMAACTTFFLVAWKPPKSQNRLFWGALRNSGEKL